MFGFVIAKGLGIDGFWTAGTASFPAPAPPAEKEDFRPVPVCHMKRRSSQVWELVRGFGSGFVVPAAFGASAGVSGGVD